MDVQVLNGLARKHDIMYSLHLKRRLQGILQPQPKGQFNIFGPWLFLSGILGSFSIHICQFLDLTLFILTFAQIVAFLNMPISHFTTW